MFENVTLDKLYIKTSKSLTQDSLWSETDGVIYETSLKGMSPDNKSAAIVLPCNDEHIDVEEFQESSFSGVLLFVYTKTEGSPEECTPCPLTNNPTLGVTFDENVLYQKVMQFTKDLANDCKIPVGFTDFILLWNALKSSIETEHYIPAIKYYNMLFDNDSVTTYSTKDCGCHGRNSI